MKSRLQLLAFVISAFCAFTAKAQVGATVQMSYPANFHPVVVNYRGRQPWVQYRDHRARYYRLVAVKQRTVVVDRRDNNAGTAMTAMAGVGTAAKFPRH